MQRVISLGVYPRGLLAALYSLLGKTIYMEGPLQRVVCFGAYQRRLTAAPCALTESNNLQGFTAGVIKQILFFVHPSCYGVPYVGIRCYTRHTLMYAAIHGYALLNAAIRCCPRHTRDTLLYAGRRCYMLTYVVIRCYTMLYAALCCYTLSSE